jgi:hypothetical protein
MQMIVSAVTTSQLQGWIGIVGGLLTATLGLVKYFNFRSSQTWSTLLHLQKTPSVCPEQSSSGAFSTHGPSRAIEAPPYAKEAVAVIAALLRDTEAGNFQKLLADGLGYAPSLAHADLQRCNLQNAYLGVRPGRDVDLSNADFFEADLTYASLRGARGCGAVFYGATLRGTVLEGCDLTAADFRGADLKGARFENAVLANARFEGAKNVPLEISPSLQAGQVTQPDVR